MNAVDLMNTLSVIYDPRQQWKIEHKLTDVLVLIICAVIAGCEGWEEIEDFIATPESGRKAPFTNSLSRSRKSISWPKSR